jgi:hypothetical protein
MSVITVEVAQHDAGLPNQESGTIWGSYAAAA